MSEKSNILYVEDNDLEYELAKRAFRIAKLNVRFKRFKTGTEVIKIIEKAEQNTLKDKDQPSLVILDLTIPEVPGLEVLEALRASETLKKTPVLILSGSSSPENINLSYEKGANSYMVKPQNFDDLVLFFQLIRDYWLSVTELPRPDFDTGFSPLSKKMAGYDRNGSRGRVNRFDF